MPLALELIDGDIILQCQHRLISANDARKWPVIPKLCFDFVPSARTCDGHGNGGGHRPNERPVGEAFGELNVEMQMIADIGNRKYADIIFLGEFSEDGVDLLLIIFPL